MELALGRKPITNQVLTELNQRRTAATIKLRNHNYATN